MARGAAPTVSPPVMVGSGTTRRPRLDISDAHDQHKDITILHIQPKNSKQKTYNTHFPRPRRGRKRTAAGSLLHNRRFRSLAVAAPSVTMRPCHLQVLEEGQPLLKSPTSSGTGASFSAGTSFSPGKRQETALKCKFSGKCFSRQCKTPLPQSVGSFVR